MPDISEAYDVGGRTLVDREGEKIGKIDDLYMDGEGGQPEWALVNMACVRRERKNVVTPDRRRHSSPACSTDRPAALLERYR